MTDIQTEWWEQADVEGRAAMPLPSRPYRNRKTGEIVAKSDLPVGALIFFESAPHYSGADGLSVQCKLPGGRWWMIDGRASNCTRQDDEKHKCWCRHGTVDDQLTVDKKGDTCSAGAGSIMVDDYHGFLRAGKLVDA